jgi:AraC-like DNA-binding protein
MATTFNLIPEAIIPKSCRQRFLPVQQPAFRALRESAVTQAGVSILNQPYRMGRVGCSFHVAIFTIGGRGQLLTPAQREDFRPGELWIGGAGQSYAYWTAKQWICVWFHLADTARWAGLRTRGFYRGPSSNGQRLWDLLDGALIESARNEAGAERSLRAYAELIAVLLERELSAAVGDAKAAQLDRKFSALWEHIDSDLQHPWTIAQMAREFRLSPVHFHRLTVSHCGATPMEMLTRLRMRRAEAMLRNPDYKLDAIAAAVGYATPFAFSRAYKRATGRSPRGPVAR